MRGFAFSTAVVTLALSGALTARAEEKVAARSNPSDQTLYREESGARRHGVALGLQAGASAGSAFGYPNDIQKVGDAAFYRDGGALFGGSGSASLKAAFLDTLNFGIWLGGNRSANSAWSSYAIAGGFEVEAFPFVKFGARLADLGFVGRFGFGGGKLARNNDPSVSAAGTQSFLGGGLFYEFGRFWKFGGGRTSFGPFLEYNLVTSLPYDQHVAVLGLRYTWYTFR